MLSWGRKLQNEGNCEYVEEDLIVEILFLLQCNIIQKEVPLSVCCGKLIRNHRSLSSTEMIRATKEDAASHLLHVRLMNPCSGHGRSLSITMQVLSCLLTMHAFNFLTQENPSSILWLIAKKCP